MEVGTSGTKLLIQTILNTKGNLFNEALVAVEHTIAAHNLTFKARVTSLFNASLLVKYPSKIFSDIATVSLGVHGNDLISEKRSYKYGAQIDFNV